MLCSRISVTAVSLAALACCAVGAAPGATETGVPARTESPSQHSPAPLPPPSERLLWSEFDDQKATFVPESVLQSQDLAKLPMMDDLRKDLLWELRIRQYPLLHPVTGRPQEPGCDRAGRGGKLGSGAGEEELVDAILARDAAVLATVDEAVPGWGWDFGGVGTLVYGTVTEVLHDKTGRFEVGGEVSFQRPGGEITVQRVRLCQTPAEGLHEPQPYDHLLIVGYASTANPGLLNGSVVFPIEGTRLLPQSYEYLKGRMEWTIEELRDALAQGGNSK